VFVWKPAFHFLQIFYPCCLWPKLTPPLYFRWLIVIFAHNDQAWATRIGHVIEVIHRGQYWGQSVMSTISVLNCTVKNICIFTDILRRVFHILTGSVKKILKTCHKISVDIRIFLVCLVLLVLRLRLPQMQRTHKHQVSSTDGRPYDRFTPPDTTQLDGRVVVSGDMHWL